jgi:putative ABC transport system permease protein
MVTMVASFRTALDQWLDVVLPAPYYLRSKGAPLPDELFATLPTASASNESPFSRVERMASSTLALDPRRPPVTLLVREIDRTSPAASLPLNGATVLPTSDLPVVWISEPLQDLYGMAPGSTIRLPLLGREQAVFIGGVWRDYARQFGAIVIASSDYRVLGGTFEPTDLALWPHPQQEDAARRWLAQATTRFGVESASSGEIRTLSLAIFDRSFAVTYALEAAALLIGIFGLATTLAASVWLRRRELATLAALGFDRQRLSRAVVFEGAMITAIGLVIGLGCGLAVGAILTHVVNPQAFHWRMPLQVPWWHVLWAATGTLVAGLAASRFAAAQATRLPAAQVLASAQ